MIPGVLWFFFFHILPLYGIVIAFQDYSPFLGVRGSEWVGLRHFRNLVSSRLFKNALVNTVWISFLKLLIGFPAPILLALALNEVAGRHWWHQGFKRTVQTFSYLPHFLSWVIVMGMAFGLFNPYFGALKNLFHAVGLSYVDVTKSPDHFIGFLVGAAVWKGAGWGSIIYLAALAGVDPQLYEAARIDGATRLQQLRHITIPSVLPTCAIVLILSVGGILREDFEQIYLFAGNNPELIRISEVFETFVYRNGIRAVDFSFPAAVGLFQSVFGAILILLTNAAAKRLGYEGIW